MRRLAIHAGWILLVLGHLGGVGCRRAVPPQPGPGLEGLASALDYYCMQMGDYPDSLDGTNVVERLRSYHPEVSLNDSWGHPVKYRKIGPGSLELRSVGADGVEGTKDDVVIRRGPGVSSPGDSPK